MDRFARAADLSLSQPPSGPTRIEAQTTTPEQTGIAPSTAPAAASAQRRGNSGLRDTQVSRPVVLESAREAAAQAAHDRTSHAWPRTPDVGASPELVRLMDGLRDQIAVLVRLGRDAGVPIQRVLPEVKCVIREAESCEQWHDPSDTLMEHVVRWTIETYYEQETR